VLKSQQSASGFVRLVLRRLFIFATLILIFVALFQLHRISDSWHYIVPSESGKLLYASTFDDVLDSWEQSEGRNAALIGDGTIRLSVSEPDTQVYSSLAYYYDDFDLSVDAQAVDGDLDNGFGVIFRQKDRENFYSFLISSDGYYRIMRRVDGEPRTLSNWHPSPYIIQNIGSVNRLRVAVEGNRFRFFINGHLVELCIPDNPEGQSTPNNYTGECTGGQWLDTLTDASIPYGRVGVTVVVDGQPTGPEVLFDNVVIFGASPLVDS
jgi:hypothetical protein